MPDPKVIIVEDDAIIGRHIQVSLKRLGYTVLAVFLSGEEAVAQIGQLEPDLVLMDISLAGEIDGVETAALIRSRYHVPIIYLTAFADPQTLQRAKITDPFGYILKPFDERILKITVEMALYKYQIEEAELNARRLAEALHTTAAILNSSLEMDEVLDLVLANTARVVPNDDVNLMMIEGDYIRVVRSYSEVGSEHRSVQLHPGLAWRELPIFRQLVETGRPVIVSHFNPADQPQLPAQMAWIRSYAGAPLRIKGQMLGFLNLASRMDGFFQERHANHLDAFVLQAGMAIENARLFDDARKRAHFLGLLNEITRLAINAVDEDQTMNGVTEKINHLFGADCTIITAWNEDQQRGIVTTSFECEGEPGDLAHWPDEWALTRSVLQAGGVLAIDDLRSWLHANVRTGQPSPLSSILGLPLVADGIRLGAVLIGFRERHRFTREEIEKGEQVSSQVALAIAKARLYAKVQQMAITDDLTGLYNRRGIFEKGRLLLAEAQKKSAPMALIWMDIDRFKDVNDTYGHYIGDQVVCEVAKCCLTGLNGCGMIGRYGGEGGDELIAILPGVDQAEARQIAEYLRLRVATQPFKTERGDVSVTISLGVSVLRGANMDLPGLLKLADQAMYAAKAAGKNCVVVSEEV